MGKCFGRCYWVQYETKWPDIALISITFRGPQVIPSHVMPTTLDIKKVINSIMAQYNRRLQKIMVGDCHGDCDCEPLKDQNSPWTKWRMIPFRRTIVKGTGEESREFAVTGEMEIRKRILKGVCLEQEL